MESEKVFTRAKSCFQTRSAESYKLGFNLLKRAASLGEIRAHEWLEAMYDYGMALGATGAEHSCITSRPPREETQIRNIT